MFGILCFTETANNDMCCNKLHVPTIHKTRSIQQFKYVGYARVQGHIEELQCCRGGFTSIILYCTALSDKLHMVQCKNTTVANNCDAVMEV